MDNISDAWSEMEEIPLGQRVVCIINPWLPFRSIRGLGVLHMANFRKCMWIKSSVVNQKHCTIVYFVGDRYDIEPSVSLKKEECEKQGQSGSSAGKNMNSIVVLKFPTGT